VEARALLHQLTFAVAAAVCFCAELTASHRRPPISAIDPEPTVTSGGFEEVNSTAVPSN
jgi:hypothetical protein